MLPIAVTRHADHDVVVHLGPPTDDTGIYRLVAGAATSPGRRRRANEDAHRLGHSVCVVADGMGGHAAGDVAAELAVTTVVDALAGAPISPAAIAQAIAAADQSIRRRGASMRSPMGTTLVGLALATVDGETVPVVFHTGDSRCYRLCDGVLDLMTRDHSVVQQLVDAGRLEPGAAAAHPRSGVVTRALGMGDRVDPDLAVLAPGPCRVLLCTDGLSDQVPARAIGRVLAGVVDPADAARRLVELTLAGPARDNVTAVVIDVLIDVVIDVHVESQIDVRVRSDPMMRDNERTVDQHVRAPSVVSVVR